MRRARASGGDGPIGEGHGGCSPDPARARAACAARRDVRRSESSGIDLGGTPSRVVVAAFWKPTQCRGGITLGQHPVMMAISDRRVPRLKGRPAFAERNGTKQAFGFTLTQPAPPGREERDNVRERDSRRARRPDNGALDGVGQVAVPVGVGGGAGLLGSFIPPSEAHAPRPCAIPGWPCLSTCPPGITFMRQRLAGCAGWRPHLTVLLDYAEPLSFNWGHAGLVWALRAPRAAAGPARPQTMHFRYKSLSVGLAPLRVTLDKQAP